MFYPAVVVFFLGIIFFVISVVRVDDPDIMW